MHRSRHPTNQATSTVVDDLILFSHKTMESDENLRHLKPWCVVDPRFVPSPQTVRFLMFMVYYTIGVLFYSNVEGWNLTDCFYFITYSLATIGYGDPHPTTQLSHLFTAFYLILGCAVILTFSHSFTRNVLCNCQDFMIDWYFKRIKGRNDEVTQREMIGHRITLTIISFLFAILSGTLFYKYNQNWTWIQGFYWTAETITAVGYGDFETTQSTRRFGIFYILFGCGLYSAAYANWFDSWNQSKQDEEFEKKMSPSVFDQSWIEKLAEFAVEKDGEEVIDKHKFILAVLVRLGVVDSAAHIKPVLKRIRAVTEERGGSLRLDDLIVIMRQWRKENDDEIGETVIENPMH